MVEPLANSTSTIRLPLKSGKATHPHRKGKTTAGTVELINNEPSLIVDRINASFLGEAEGVIEINGESMSPTYPNGCRIAIARLNNIRMLDWGRCYYIIDKNWQGMLKRVHPSDQGLLNSIKLVSDHPDQLKFPSFHRSWDQIEAIFKILAFIVKL